MVNQQLKENALFVVQECTKSVLRSNRLVHHLRKALHIFCGVFRIINYMPKLFIVFLSLITCYSLFAIPAFARITPDDIYKQTRTDFENNLARISNQAKKQLIIQADWELKNTNQAVCDRFEMDLDKMAAVLDEEKSRQGITNTVVAYGQGSTPLDSAAYSLNYAAEALAYQRSQDYTPNISGTNLAGVINNSSANLKSNLQILRTKILNAKTEVKKAINAYEK